MKKFNLSAFALCLSLAVTAGFTSCMKDDVAYSDYYNREHKATDQPSTDPQPAPNPGDNTQNQGTNTNPSGDNANTVAVAAAHNLNVPKLKGGSSKFLVETLSNGEVNYTSEWDSNLKSARWTAFSMYKSNMGGNVGRIDDWHMNPTLSKSDYISENPYKGSGYDRGHLIPSHARQKSREANRQTFSYSNMMPQKHGFNASPGAWGKMEDWSREFWQKQMGDQDTLFICRGGTIDKADQILTKLSNGLIVPKYFYSVHLLKYKTSANGEWQYKMIGFWFEHKEGNVSSLKPYVKSVDEIEELSGVDFFCNLSSDLENRLEAMSADEVIKLWNIK